MILVDTSVWIAHLRQGRSRLVALLEEAMVLTHPFVLGEIALGKLEQRNKILDLLGNLPAATMATHCEVLALIDRHALAGAGIGWVDAHLLAAARLSHASLWTRDRRLAGVAAQLGLAP